MSTPEVDGILQKVADQIGGSYIKRVDHKQPLSLRLKKELDNLITELQKHVIGIYSTNFKIYFNWFFMQNVCRGISSFVV